jgi:hypothetical protein
MSAGLPGLGLGGLLFIFSALLAPFRQVWRSINGRSRPGDWPMVGRQFAQAVAMVVAIDLTLRLAYVVLDATGLGNPPAMGAGTVLPLTLIGITTALLAALLAVAKLSDLALRIRTADLPGVPATLPRPSPVRALALGSTAAVAWIALLAGGASELSPLMERATEAPTAQRPDLAQASPSKPIRRPERGPAEAAPIVLTANRADAEQLNAAGPSQGEGEGDTGGSLPASDPAARPPSIARPSPERRSPSTSSPPVAPAPEPQTPVGEAASDATTPPEPTGPPPTAGPPDDSPASEKAGPPPHAGSG